MCYKYGVLVIDLELGMFLEYSCIGSYRKLVQEMCDHQDSWSYTVKLCEHFISVINVHLIIHYHKDR